MAVHNANDDDDSNDNEQKWSSSRLIPLILAIGTIVGWTLWIGMWKGETQIKLDSVIEHLEKIDGGGTKGLNELRVITNQNSKRLDDMDARFDRLDTAGGKAVIELKGQIGQNSRRLDELETGPLREFRAMQQAFAVDIASLETTKGQIRDLRVDLEALKTETHAWRNIPPQADNPDVALGPTWRARR